MAKRSSVCGPYRIMSVSPRSRKQSSRNVNRYPPRRITRRGYCFFMVYTAICFCSCDLCVIVSKLRSEEHTSEFQSRPTRRSSDLDEYIDRRKWLSDQAYADLIALCQFLPGPASSQVGMSIGILRGGLLGGVIAFLGFTLPSVFVLVIFALLYQN